MKKFHIIILILSYTYIIQAQNLPDIKFKKEYECHVKSVDEFMRRFNCEEIYPGLSKEDKNFRQKNIYSLFDFNMNHEKKNLANDFVNVILSDSINISYTDTLWYARAVCDVKYKDRQYPVILYLRTEKIRDNRYRWVLSGADGLFNGIIDMDKNSAISPVEHEIHFMELNSIMKNDKKNIFSYREKNRKMDQLSIFMAFVQAGDIAFSQVSKLSFLFFNVPGYMFEINEFGRDGTNAGWLISDFIKIDEIDKAGYISEMLNKK